MRILHDMALQSHTAIIVVTHDEKIIPTFKRIYHIRDGMTVEEAQGYVAERAAKLPPPADVLPDPMGADRLAAEMAGT
jgi:putative ABC transport system ATP-binding protein